MAALGSLTANNLADLFFHTANSANWTDPPAIWVGLCTTYAASNVTNECTATGNGYGRVQVTWNTATAGAASGPNATATYTSASGSWGTIHGYIICAASTGSTGTSQYLAYGSVSPTVAVTTNDTVSFAANAMTLTFS